MINLTYNLVTRTVGLCALDIFAWVTEFALMIGISTKAFGDMRMFVEVLM